MIPIPLSGSSLLCAKAFGTTTDRKYGIISTEAEGWVALSVQKEIGVGLGNYRVYDPESSDNKKKYIVLEFAKYADTMEMLTDLGSVQSSGSDNKVDVLTDTKRMKEYSAALIHHQ